MIHTYFFCQKRIPLKSQLHLLTAEYPGLDKWLRQRHSSCIQPLKLTWKTKSWRIIQTRKRVTPFYVRSEFQKGDLWRTTLYFHTAIHMANITILKLLKFRLCDLRRKCTAFWSWNFFVNNLKPKKMCNLETEMSISSLRQVEGTRELRFYRIIYYLLHRWRDKA